MQMDDYTARCHATNYRAIKAGMKQIKKGNDHGSRCKKRTERLTEISQGSGKPILRQGVGVSRAAKKLYEYEETGISPGKIRELIERERNLTEKVKKMQDW